jgi:hypothetical protein
MRRTLRKAAAKRLRNALQGSCNVKNSKVEQIEVMVTMRTSAFDQNLQSLMCMRLSGVGCDARAQTVEVLGGMEVGKSQRAGRGERW